jgi:hypothetical protein
MHSRADGYLTVALQPLLIGAPTRIRTWDLPLRRGPRYPAVPSGRVVRGARLYSAALLRVLMSTIAAPLGERQSLTTTQGLQDHHLVIGGNRSIQTIDGLAIDKNFHVRA